MVNYPRAALAVASVRGVAVEQHSSAGLDAVCIGVPCYGPPAGPLLKPLPERRHNPASAKPLLINRW